MSFPNRELWREGLRGLSSRRTATAVCAAVAVLVSVATVLVGQLDVDRRVAAWEEFARDGGYSYTVVSPTAISQQRCDDFRGTEGVRASGVIRAIERVKLRSQPDSPAYLVRVTPGLIGAMFPAERIAPDAGVIAGERLAGMLGLVAGADVAITPDQAGSASLAVVVDQVSTTPARTETWNDAIVVVEPASGDGGTCIVEFEPAYAGFALALASHWFAADAVTLDPVTVVPREGVGAIERIGSRASTLVPVVGGILVLLVACAQWWARRNEFAVYRLLGVARHRLWRILVAETLVGVALPAALAAAATTIAVLPMIGQEGAVALGWDLTSLATIIILVPGVGFALVSGVRTTDAIGGR